MEKNFDGMAKIRYEEKYKAFVFDLIGDTADGVALLTMMPNNPDLVAAWDTIVEGF